jgi:hypothetical protein
MRAAVPIALGLAALAAAAATIVLSESRVEPREAPADSAPAKPPAKPTLVRMPRRRGQEPPPDPEAAMKSAWDAALALYRAGKAVDALEGLAGLRRDAPEFFAKPDRAALLHEMELAAVAALSRVVRGGTLEDARALAARIRAAVTDPARLAEVDELMAAAERRAVAPTLGGDVVERATAAADKAALDRHLQRFAARGSPPKKPDWVDDQIAGVDAANAALAKEPDPLEVADPVAAEKRRLDQLDKLRERNALSLLDHIDGSLAWLALHQADDGHFGADATAARCVALKHDPVCIAAGTKEPFPLAATGLAVLAYLDFRDQDVRRLFEPTLARGVAWIVAQQQKDGSFAGGGRSGYPAGIGLMALGQAAGSSHDQAVVDALKKGLDFYSRHAGEMGGYRYSLDQEGDLSVTGWYVQAVEAATNAGVEVPDVMRQNLSKFVKYVWRGEGRFGYQAAGNDSASLWPVGALSMTILRPEETTNLVDGWRAALLKGPPKKSVYSLYYGVRELLALDGKLPDAWKKTLDELAAAQTVKGPAAGMIPLPDDPWMRRGGPTIATAFATLTMEHSLYRR